MRQQERTQAMAAARSIPSSITTSRLLSMVTQMTAILHQLELSEAPLNEDCRMLQQFVALHRIETSSDDLAEAVAVALLLRTWSQPESLETNKELGIWNEWKCSSYLTKGLAAIEKLGWEDWIPVLLPWLSQWHSLCSDLLQCSSTPHLSSFLLVSLAHHAEHALLGSHPLDAAPVMKALDSYLLQSPSCYNNFGGGKDTREALINLKEVLDSWLAQHLKQKPGKDTDADEEVFQTACQLRTRLALCSSLSTSEPEVEKEKDDKKNILGGVDTGILRNSLENSHLIEIEEIKSIWQHVLYLEGPRKPLFTKRSLDAKSNSSCINTRVAVGLAAHAAVSALFLHSNTAFNSILSNVSTRLKRSNILSDVHPAGPARVTLAALNMLEHAAAASTTTALVQLKPSTNKRGSLEKKTLEQLLWSQSLQILPSLIWAVASLVENLQQKQELLDLFLGSSCSNSKELLEPFTTKHKNARVLLESGIALTTFHQWALKECIALSNLVRTDEVLSKITVLGEEEPGMDAAVHAVFPAALLCPGILLQVLLDGAATQPGKAMLLVGILQQLPNLKFLTKLNTTTNNSQPLLLELLQKRLETSSTASLDEDQRNALQHCILALCSPCSNFLPKNGDTISTDANSPLVTTAAVDAGALIEYGILPAIQHVVATPVESAQDLSMLFKLSRLLLESTTTESTASVLLRDVASSLSSGGRTLVGSQLSLLSFKFLDFSSRRIDLSSLGLLLPREVIEEAYAVAQLCRESKFVSLASQPSSLSPSPQQVVGNKWIERNDALCNSLAAYLLASSSTSTLSTAPSNVLHGIEPNQIQDALVIACAVMLPCCATEEASKLYTWIKEAVEYTLKLTKTRAIQALPTTNIIDGAVIEVLCRAVHAVAFIPDLIPIAGEEIPRGNRPSQLRCRAVGRLLQHLSLASQAALDPLPPASLLSAPPSPSITGALIVRIFKEISRCAASINEYYDVSTLHICLLQLVNILKKELTNNTKLTLTVEMKSEIAAAVSLVNDPALNATIASIHIE